MAIIHWFRRDLRITDNSALAEACADSAGDVIPVFVLDERILRGDDVAPARVQFLLQCLRELDDSLRQRGAQLVVLRGDSIAELMKLVRCTGAQAVYYNRDYTPLASRRDARAEVELRAIGCEVRSFKDLVIHETDEVLTKTGKPYSVFTPYKRAWMALPKPTERDTPTLHFAPSSDLSSLGIVIPTPHELKIPETRVDALGGERTALGLLDTFENRGDLDAYNTQRDFMAEDATSRLSPHLRFGTLSPRTCYWRASARTVTQRNPPPASADLYRTGADVWISELIWREFYAQVLNHQPHVDHANFNRAYDAMRWGSGDNTTDALRFQAWIEGRTGYPIVDAAMRQLRDTAWMHNRARMIVASFFTKDLLLDWRLGESYFMRMLVDGDPASNNGGWQWAASTGTDAQPYFRIFNPILQGQRFDQQGRYVRRYVPELVGVSDAHIHAPWLMSTHEQTQSACIIGRDYPSPIVDHATQKGITLQRFKELRS